MGRENITEKLEEIDKERSEHPDLFGEQPHFYNQESNDFSQINSGMTNGQTPLEIVRREITGQNGGAIQ